MTGSKIYVKAVLFAQNNNAVQYYFPLTKNDTESLFFVGELFFIEL
jgi:hypothetical protein